MCAARVSFATTCCRRARSTHGVLTCGFSVMFRTLFLLCLLTTAQVAIAGPLSFKDALSIATRSSPDIAVQTARVESARSSAKAAGALPDPRLVVGVDNLPVTGAEQGSLTRDFMTMRKIGVMQEIPNAGRRDAQETEAAAAIEQAQAEQRIAILSIRRDTALAWLTRYYLERKAALLDDLERENSLFDQTVQARFSAGNGNPADVIEPKQEAADIADRRDALAADLARAKSALKRWVGDAAVEALAGDPPELSVDTTLLEGHVHEHPELAVFVPMAEKAQAEVHEAEAAKRPDWGVELSYGRRGSDFSDMVSLEVTIGLPIFGGSRQDPLIAAKRQDLSRIESERDAMLRDHTQELEANLAEYEVRTRQLARLRNVRLPLARQKVDYQFATYRAGKADLSAVLTARRELIDVRMTEVELDGQREATLAKLYYFYGPGANESADSPQQEGGG
jgi:outer membrane protein, heavy metal efflux system